jgi:hypothetical protein
VAGDLNLHEALDYVDLSTRVVDTGAELKHAQSVDSELRILFDEIYGELTGRRSDSDFE